MANFEKALELVLKNEGGYVNDPNDNGGETYKGVSRRANPQWSGWKIIDGYKKKYKDFKKKLDSDNELQKCVKSLYRSNYWNPIKGDDLVHQDMAEEMFDAAVNFGITKAIKLAQKTVGFEQSGVMTNILVERLNQEK
ncbi:glycosyl hydrolase 108 family protein [uncultured Bacteroides sp.]|uniref:glycosyl hydrolase 108 family protein n=1 Tax=uncultured Bacteroides sp. TaxID=162156 RepID=UPI0026283B6C|nr:glycosyl hydrolase 108 family protein [uncultured Bacteroides sp.]